MGDTATIVATLTDDEVAGFWRRAIIEHDGCWGWTGSKDSGGYAQMTIRRGNIRRYVRASHVSYAIAHGHAPATKYIMHTCDSPLCTRPDHLVAGDHRANMRDCSSKGRIFGQRKTHCPQGHEYTPDNTGVTGGKRWCRICKQAASVKKRDKRRQTKELP